MKNRITIALIILLAAGIGFFHYKYKERPDQQDIKTFMQVFTGPKILLKSAPDFEVNLIDGKVFKLSDHVKNKIIIINFFATWCGPCKMEIPELNSFYDRNKDSDIIMIGVDVGETIEAVNIFMRENEIHYPVAVVDKGSKIVSDYLINAYPTTVVIGYNGTVEMYEPGAIMNAQMILDTRIKMIRDIRDRTKNRNNRGR